MRHSVFHLLTQSLLTPLLFPTQLVIYAPYNVPTAETISTLTKWSDKFIPNLVTTCIIDFDQSLTVLLIVVTNETPCPCADGVANVVTSLAP